MSEAVKAFIEKCFEVNCEALVKDNLLSVEDFKNYLEAKIKVNGKTNNLQGKVDIICTETSVMVSTQVKFSKKYLKYLGNKFLHKKELKDWVRISSNGKDTYIMSYYKTGSGNDE